MADVHLDLGPLKRAIDRLEEGWARYQVDTTDAQIRDGLIQRFEFTYEISHKTLKRYLESISATPEQFDSMAFADLVRSASEQGLLLHAWPEWRRYRDMRSRTSHTYNENVALEVVGGIPAFLLEAKYLYEQMRRRL